MSFVTKKIIKIFSDGSINFTNTSFKKFNNVKINKKDHIICSFNKKNNNLITENSKNFESFKTRYLKF